MQITLQMQIIASWAWGQQTIAQIITNCVKND